LKFAEDGYKGQVRDTTKDMKKYEPMIFEDCFIKGNGKTKLISKLEIQNSR